ncbi:Protein CBG25568 [Caenorhabditis briggsae]|uniref:Protein CBG25568 n=1 Tax=Caenorhabditis briggsae TaxID=6238 RepID=B6IF55_CAEBR|nr:Protein CBG25568 [Caenorhabditis briggsae]CAR98535.1 Protein CBG25568 [Caenorhabditis briggsae]
MMLNIGQFGNTHKKKRFWVAIHRRAQRRKREPEYGAASVTGTGRGHQDRRAAKK